MRHWAVILGVSIGVAAQAAAPTSNSRIDRLNQAFLSHLAALGPEQSLAVETIRDGWRRMYRDESPESFVPDALAVLYPAYRDGLAAFDANRLEDAQRALEPLRGSRDRFLSANATYFVARALIEQGKFEEAEGYLRSLGDDRQRLDEFTPYAPHIAFLQAFVEARNLKFEDAGQTLAALRERYADAPEAVQIGVRQMLLELERRETGTLDEVATVMDYVADRLTVVDVGDRVRKRQDQILDLLDKLIEEAEQREKGQGGGGGQRAGAPKPGQSPRKPAEKSEAPEASGSAEHNLHAAPKISPGESWGNLPPTEREKILQSLRERFPSRYRQLVEQYYRSLAEQK